MSDLTPWAELAETHSAIVVFAGDRAYKLKKPVTFDFLDFSTRRAPGSRRPPRGGPEPTHLPRRLPGRVGRARRRRFDLRPPRGHATAAVGSSSLRWSRPGPSPTTTSARWLGSSRCSTPPHLAPRPPRPPDPRSTSPPSSSSTSVSSSASAVDPRRSDAGRGRGARATCYVRGRARLFEARVRAGGMGLRRPRRPARRRHLLPGRRPTGPRLPGLLRRAAVRRRPRRRRVPRNGSRTPGCARPRRGARAALRRVLR